MRQEEIKVDKSKKTIRINVRQYTMIFAMLAIWAYFQFATGGIFMMPRNLNNLFLQMCYIGYVPAGWFL